MFKDNRGKKKDMKTFKYLHIMHNEKFIAPYIEFIKKNFIFEEHLFIINGGISETLYKVLNYDNIINLSHNYTRITALYALSKKINLYMERAEKIILHSLFVPNLVNYLFFNQKYLKKCYWIIWGGDLYSLQNKNKTLRTKLFDFKKKQIIKKIFGIICYNESEYNLAKKWAGAEGNFYQSFYYVSNLYKEIEIREIKKQVINIQIGNSADPTNNHIEAMEKLKKFKDENINIFVPLSYGDKEYSKKIITYGKSIFGDKFIPIVDLMPFEQYISWLGKIDIAIFNHNRQQAMGNITTLLGLGKKVYIKSHIITWDLCQEVGVTVYDTNNIQLDILDDKTKEKNMKRIKIYFSQQNLINQWKTILGSTIEIEK